MSTSEVNIGYQVFNPLDVDTSLTLPTRDWRWERTVALKAST